MKIISHNEIINLKISWNEIFDWVETIITQKNKMILPPKLSMKREGGVFYNTMPSILPLYNIAGVKVVSRYPQRVPSLDSQILLYDLNTGKCKALLDGNFITAVRTGAVAVYSIKTFAKKDFKTIGIIGLGNTSRATIQMLLEVYKDNNFIFKLYRYKDQHLSFKERFKKYSNVKWEIYDTYDEVISESDVVISAITYTNDNLTKEENYKPGCLVVPIHTRGFKNCALFCDKVYADDEGHVKGFEFFDRFKYFSEVTDVVSGERKGRVNNEERIIVYNIGISLQDIYIANKIYEISNKNSEISLNPPKEKFWI